MSARVLPAAVLRALRELRVTVSADSELDALAWASAVEVAFERWDSTMELAAARSFCLALLAGDLDRAARCAVWIFAPGEAFRTAQAELNAGAVWNPAPGEAFRTAQAELNARTQGAVS